MPQAIGEESRHIARLEVHNVYTNRQLVNTPEVRHFRLPQKQTFLQVAIEPFGLSQATLVKVISNLVLRRRHCP